jgi:tetratricopeptide (TPR) repeat protein
MVSFAQSDRQHIREGNRQYRQQKFDKAEVDFRKAVDKNNRNPQAYYNLGCALMQQQKDSLAIINLENAGKLEKNKTRKAKVYHNIGVIYQSHQMFAEAIEAYKESLRNNPNDNETRYNLALCQRQLKNQNKNNKQNNKNNQKNKGKDNQNDQNQKDKNQNKPKQQSKEQMSKDNAEQLLQAALQEEKNTQQKMKKQQSMPQKRRLQKNW